MALATLQLVLVDHPDSGSDGADLAAICAAIDSSLQNDFSPVYNLAVSMSFAKDGVVPPGGFPIGLFGAADQEDALGYHSKGFGKVFPKLDKLDGVDLSSTIDHEAKETAKDLYCDLMRMGSDGRPWADEPADAVEQDTYVVNGYKLSNFVLPAWYSGEGGKFDFCGTLTAPLTVSSGGYAQWLDQDKGWQQIVHDQVAPRSYRQRQDAERLSRGARRRWKFQRTQVASLA